MLLLSCGWNSNRSPIDGPVGFSCLLVNRLLAKEAMDWPTTDAQRQIHGLNLHEQEKKKKKKEEEQNELVAESSQCTREWAIKRRSVGAERRSFFVFEFNSSKTAAAAMSCKNVCIHAQNCSNLKTTRDLFSVCVISKDQTCPKTLDTLFSFFFFFWKPASSMYWQTTFSCITNRPTWAERMPES